MKKRILCALLTLSLLAAMAPASLAVSEDVWTWTNPDGSGESYTLTITDGNKLSFTGTLGSWYSPGMEISAGTLEGSDEWEHTLDVRDFTDSGGKLSGTWELEGADDIHFKGYADVEDPLKCIFLNCPIFSDGKGGFWLTSPPPASADAESKTVGNPNGEFYTYTLDGLELILTFRAGGWADKAENLSFRITMMDNEGKTCEGYTIYSNKGKYFSDGQVHSLHWTLPRFDKLNFEVWSSELEYIGGLSYVVKYPDEPASKMSFYLDETTWGYSFTDHNVTIQPELSDKVTRENAAHREYNDVIIENKYQDEIPQAVVAQSNKICSGLRTDMEKLRAIHDWVCENIYYDVPKNQYISGGNPGFVSDQLEGESSMEATLRTRKGVCGDYSELTRGLVAAQGIPCVYVAGKVSPGDSWSYSALLDDWDIIGAHAWNEAFVDGRWVVLDTTWDSGNCYTSAGEWEAGDVSWEWFDTDYVEFAKRHRSNWNDICTLKRQGELEISPDGISPESSGTAYQTVQTITIYNNEGSTSRVNFNMYQIRDEKGGVTNYVQLRDLAVVLDGHNSKFDVTWSSEEGIGIWANNWYSNRTGNEMNPPFSGDQDYVRYDGTLRVNGNALKLDAFILQNGYTYYKLRDLGQVLGFNVGWSKDTGIFIEPEKYYTGVN